MKSITLISFLIFLTISLTHFAHQISASPFGPKLKKNLQARFATKASALDNDFENGATDLWTDESPAYVNWGIETYGYPSEINSPAPRPLTGSKYSRVIRNENLASGLAVLRSIPYTAVPGEGVTFDFWIRSKRTEGNNLELVWSVNGVEYTLIGLSSFSTPTNNQWRKTERLPIPVKEPTQGELVFFGYCGANAEDAIAIDNIVISDKVEPECTTLTSNAGTITSPNYPQNYSNNEYVCWLIPEAYFISVTFNSFSTEYEKDFLHMYMGTNTSAPRYNSYHGEAATSISLYTESFLFVFTSNENNTYKGFSAYYEVKPPTAPTTTPDYSGTTHIPSNCWDCSADYTGSFSGIIQSPNYPNNYCDFLDCRHSIFAPEGNRIRITFMAFDTQPDLDYVTVYNQASITSLDILLNHSGNTVPNPVETTSNECMLRFQTNFSVNGTGWQARYEVI